MRAKLWKTPDGEAHWCAFCKKHLPGSVGATPYWYDRDGDPWMPVEDCPNQDEANDLCKWAPVTEGVMVRCANGHYDRTTRPTIKNVVYPLYICGNCDKVHKEIENAAECCL